MKTVETIKSEIAKLESELVILREAHDTCAHSHEEVRIQIAISNATGDLNQLKNLLRNMEGSSLSQAASLMDRGSK